MTRNRVRSGGRPALVSLLVTLVVLTGCGGGSTPRTPAGGPGSSSPTSSSPDPSESTSPPDVPLPDGPWIPSPSLRIKVPKGFKGEAEFGVTTLRKGDLAITIYDPGAAGDSDLRAAIRTERKLSFTGPTEVESGTATIDGQDVQTFVMTGTYQFFRRVAYGFGVTGSDGDTRFVVLGFEGEHDPTTHQDTIDSVLASIQWSTKVVG